MSQSADIRKLILKKRDELSLDEKRKKSIQIRDSLLGQKTVLSSGSVFIYVNFRSEVETLGVINTLLGMGKQVSVPLTRVAQRRLDIISITDPDAQLIPGYCNIPEPREEQAKNNQINPEQLDLIVLPGSAFDLRGGRFGYGGGFYDRLLEQIPDVHRIALAYDLQVVDLLPLEPHDEILDLVITESRMITGRT